MDTNIAAKTSIETTAEDSDDDFTTDYCEISIEDNCGVFWGVITDKEREFRIQWRQRLKDTANTSNEDMDSSAKCGKSGVKCMPTEASDKDLSVWITDQMSDNQSAQKDGLKVADECPQTESPTIGLAEDNGRQNEDKCHTKGQTIGLPTDYRYVEDVNNMSAIECQPMVELKTIDGQDIDWDEDKELTDLSDKSVKKVAEKALDAIDGHSVANEGNDGVVGDWKCFDDSLPSTSTPRMTERLDSTLNSISSQTLFNATNQSASQLIQTYLTDEDFDPIYDNTFDEGVGTSGPYFDDYH